MIKVQVPDEVVLQEKYPSFVVDNTDENGKVVITCTNELPMSSQLKPLQDQIREMNPDLYIRGSIRPEPVGDKLRTVMNFKMKKVSKKAAPEEDSAEKAPSKKKVSPKKDPTKKVPFKRVPPKKTPSKRISPKK